MRKLLMIFCALAAMALCAACAKTEYEYFGGIHVTAADLESGSPVFNADVTLSPGGANGLTDTDGRCQFANLEPGQYTVNIHRAPYRADRKSVTVRVAENAQVNFSLVTE